MNSASSPSSSGSLDAGRSKRRGTSRVGVVELVISARSGTLHVVVQIDGLTVRCPKDEVERVRSLIRAADGAGEVPAKVLVLLFSWHPERHRTTSLATALGWLGATLVEAEG